MNPLVIIPTYDEAANIALMLDALLTEYADLDVLVVDDSSPDGTADIVADVARTQDCVNLLVRPGKDGLGGAYRAGFAWAIERGYEIVVEMDADFSHPVDRLGALVEATQTNDLVIGSRYVPGGAVVNWPWHRILISRAGNAYVRLLLRLPVADATAGFRAFRTQILQTIDIGSTRSNGYGFQVETTWRVLDAGGRVTELPITFTERVRGRSKMSTGIALEAVRMVTRQAVRRGRGAQPAVGAGRPRPAPGRRAR